MTRDLGRIAVCSKGRLGVITTKRKVACDDGTWYFHYSGYGVFDKKPWESIQPRRITPADEQLLRKAAHL